MTLEEWQERLERHFEALARLREGSGFPIFALEHGLSDEEIEEISSLLRSHLKSRRPLFSYWLLWAIYAAERGYTYNGDEYWRSFEEQTPEWTPEDRYKLVSWFSKFQKVYNGVVPSGRWANYFRIIAWPITHAILPRYLQRQFAKLLYDLRSRLVHLAEPNPIAIGQMLAVNADHTSTRFQKFLQQEELTGRIVLSLLGTAPAEGKEPIYPSTLQRIVGDLEQIRSAREWLKETQRVVTNFRGIGHGTGPSGLQPRLPHGGDTGPNMGQLGIRPSLLLVHRGGGTWSVRLEVPSFRSVAAINTEVHSFLKRTRCRINGAPDIKPAGWLLSGNRKSLLKSWPDPHKPLIQLRQPHETIDHLLESECRLSSGPVWLFKIAQDGNAREITSHIVRPGSNYIVVTTGTQPESHAFILPCHVDCADVKAIRLSIPSSVSADDTAWLRQLGLQVTRTIRVWPAGLPGRGWDGEGSSEWLTTEAPRFGIMHDYPVSAYVLRLNNGAETVITAGERGQPVFVRIAPLPAGTHLLTIKARPSISPGATPPVSDAEGFIQLRVRDPELWIPGVVSHPCLIATLDPPDVDLDIFWRNEVSLSVLGPEDHTVTCTVSLTGRDGGEILSEQIGGRMELPVKPEAWRKRFEQFLRSEKNTWSYLEAAGGCLAIAGEELGHRAFQFEHDVLPLRWVLRRDHHNIVLRLIDETGEEEASLSILFFSMERPLKEGHRAPNEALRGIVAEPPGGLFYARHGEHCATVIVSTQLAAKSLKALRIIPTFSDSRKGSSDLTRCLQLLESWSNTRLYGPLVGMRQETVIDGLLGEIYGRLCGKSWTSKEAAFRKNPEDRRAVEALQHTVDSYSGFASALLKGSAKMDDDMTVASQWYADVAQRHNISARPRLCDFALRVASQPHRLSETFGTNEIRNLLNQVKNKPAIVRGVRLLALLSASRDPSQPMRMLPRWKW